MTRWLRCRKCGTRIERVLDSRTFETTGGVMLLEGRADGSTSWTRHTDERCREVREALDIEDDDA